jgi:starch synthase
MPSLYEPCGLSQMYAMRYGTVPVVRRTGGLADTVRHGATGIVFNDYRVDALLWAVDEALAAFASPERLRALRVAGMNEDFGWSVSAKKYLDLFRSLP